MIFTRIHWRRHFIMLEWNTNTTNSMVFFNKIIDLRMEKKFKINFYLYVMTPNCAITAALHHTLDKHKKPVYGWENNSSTLINLRKYCFRPNNYDSLIVHLNNLNHGKCQNFHRLNFILTAIFILNAFNVLFAVFVR